MTPRPPDQQVYVVPNQPNLDKTPDFYESVYERTSRRLVRYLFRSTGPAQPRLRDHPGRRAGVERQRRRHGLDLQARSGADVERRQPGHRQRLGGDIPLRRGSGSRLGLHLVLPGRHEGVGRGDRRGDPARGARRAPGRRRARADHRDAGAGAVPAGDASLLLPALGRGAGGARAALQLQPGDLGELRADEAGRVACRPAGRLREEPRLHGQARCAGQPGGHQARRLRRPGSSCTRTTRSTSCGTRLRPICWSRRPSSRTRSTPRSATSARTTSSST